MTDYDSFKPKCILHVYQFNTFMAFFSNINAYFQTVQSTLKKSDIYENKFHITR